MRRCLEMSFLLPIVPEYGTVHALNRLKDSILHIALSRHCCRAGSALWGPTTAMSNEAEKMEKRRRGDGRSGSGKISRLGKDVNGGADNGDFRPQAAVVATASAIIDSGRVNPTPETVGILVRGKWKRGAKTQADLILNKVRSVTMQIFGRKDRNQMPRRKRGLSKHQR